MKRFIILFIVVFMLVMTSFAVEPSHIKTDILIESYQEGVDYMNAMYKCALDGSPYAMQMGYIYEQQRNLKIDEENLEHEKTNFFTTHQSGDHVISAMKAQRLKNEHFAAGLVYEYLLIKGYSDEVIAGILGNMMAECGGQTLDLQWGLKSHGYYGVCMWSLYYAPQLDGMNLIQQLNYMTGDGFGGIETMITEFGGNYEHFIEMTDPGNAARYFCSYYERGSGVQQRMRNANVAYKWIKGE